MLCIAIVEKLISKNSNLLVFILDKHTNFKTLKAIILSQRPGALGNIFPHKNLAQDIVYYKFPLWDIRTDLMERYQNFFSPTYPSQVIIHLILKIQLYPVEIPVKADSIHRDITFIHNMPYFIGFNQVNLR